MPVTGQIYGQLRGQINGQIASLAGGLATYTGAVSTGTRHPNSISASMAKWNSRSPHKNPGQNVTRLKVVLPNWASSSGGESYIGGTITYTASIEYPAGTFTQITFSGNASGTCANAANLESDWVNISIPKNTLYWVRIFGSPNVANFIYFSFDVWAPQSITTDTAHGCILELNATVDKTLGGSLTQTYNHYGFYPVAILSDTNNPSFLMLGDSINDGAGDSYDGTNFGIGYGERALEPYYGFMNVASYGEQAANFNASHTGRAALAQYCSHITSDYGINDIRSGGLNAAGVRSQLTTMFGLFPTKKGIQYYISTSTTSTDSYATAANQTVTTGFALGGVRDQLNVFIANNQCGNLANVNLMQAFVDPTTNKFLANGTAGKYTTDGIHPSQFAAKAAAALFTTSMIP